MITTLSLTVGRHHRAILVLGLTAAVVYLAALDGRGAPSWYLVSGALLLAGLVLYSTPRPRFFEVRPQAPAFSTVAGAADLLLLLGSVSLITGWIGVALQGEPVMRWQLVLWSVMIVLAAGGRWRGTGLELTPEGVRDRGALGTLVVPWDALPATQVPEPGDKRTSLSVRYAHPELVRRRGLTGRKRLATDNIDPRFAAQVIRYYVTHPESRSAIGTEAEYRRLLEEFGDDT